MPHRVAFASGCFDLPHAGHVQFLETAAAFGALTVAVGSDRTVLGLKGRPPVMREDERLRIVRSFRAVSGAFIARGCGVLDFAAELEELKPDVFVVNGDGDAACKADLCERLGIEYVVLPREPPPGLPLRSSSQLRARTTLPYRLDLAGGWLDQPFVSSAHPGPVIVASIDPKDDQDFDSRSGMANSTRETARRLWGARLPFGDSRETARLLFGAENPPGKQPIAGSQDALGIALAGVSRLEYDGGYWPSKIDSSTDDSLLDWLESRLWLYPLGPRAPDFDAFAGRDVTRARAARLADAGDRCWRAIIARDENALARAVTDSFRAQVEMFPAMMTPTVEESLRGLQAGVLGCKLTGAGGGGYLVLIAPTPPRGCIGLSIRRQVF